MRKASMLLAAMTLAVELFAGTVLALMRTGDNGPNRLMGTAENGTPGASGWTTS